MIGTLIVKSVMRKGFATVTGGNVEALTAVFHQEATVIYPTKGTISGLPAILDFYRDFKTVFPQVQVEVKEVAVEKLFDLVGTNVLAVCFEVHTTNRQGITFTQEGMMLIHTRRGKITRLRYYFADTTALANAWSASE